MRYNTINQLNAPTPRHVLYLDDVLGHVDLVRAQEVQHVHASVVARESQHCDVKVDAQLEGVHEDTEVQGEGGRGGGSYDSIPTTNQQGNELRRGQKAVMTVVARFTVGGGGDVNHTPPSTNDASFIEM